MIFLRKDKIITTYFMDNIEKIIHKLCLKFVSYAKLLFISFVIVNYHKTNKS